MKLLRFGPSGQERAGLLDASGNIRDLASIVDDWTGATLSKAVLDKVRTIDPTTLPLVSASERLGPCIGSVPNFIAAGLNYVDHALETNTPIPAEPVLFSKTTSCISGANDDIPIPPESTKLDWEVEIAVVIGEAAYNIAEADALSVVAGYCVCNDVSERAFQIERSGQWLKGKSSPGFGPLGPWLVTADEIGNVQDLDLWLDVNGTRRQTGSTAKMIFPVAHLIHYASKFMALQPGDVLTTGTPAGVGIGMEPQIFLKAGDLIELGIDGLGCQRQVVRATR